MHGTRHPLERGSVESVGKWLVDTSFRGGSQSPGWRFTSKAPAGDKVAVGQGRLTGDKSRRWAWNSPAADSRRGNIKSRFRGRANEFSRYRGTPKKPRAKGRKRRTAKWRWSRQRDDGKRKRAKDEEKEKEKKKKNRRSMEQGQFVRDSKTRGKEKDQASRIRNTLSGERGHRRGGKDSLNIRVYWNSAWRRSAMGPGRCGRTRSHDGSRAWEPPAVLNTIHRP